MRLLAVTLLLFGCSNHPIGSSVPDKHRPTAPTCPSDRPAINCSVLAGPMSCKADADCAGGVNGRCAGNGHDGCMCSYDTCTTDADCPAGKLCDCRNLWHYGATNGPNVCIASNCRVDADCGAGG